MDLQESQTGFDIYEYIHGSQFFLKNKITGHKTNDYFPILHETHKSFQAFEIIGTGSSFILIFSKTLNRWFFDSETLKKLKINNSLKILITVQHQFSPMPTYPQVGDMAT